MRIYGALKQIFDTLLPPPEAVVRVSALSFETLAALYAPHEHQGGQVVSLLPYRTTEVRDLIWALKYHKSEHAAALCAQILAEHLMSECADILVYTNKNKPLLIPVPLSTGRKRERGYDHLALVLSKLDAADLCEYRSDLVIKVRNTPRQTDLSPQERTKNLVNAFRVRNPNDIYGRDIIVFDDVCTTGSTFKEMCTTLLAAGALSVRGITLAH